MKKILLYSALGLSVLGNNPAKAVIAVSDQATFGGTGQENGKMIRTSDGGYIVAANSDSPASGNKSTGGFGGNDIWVVKLDSAFEKQWEVTLGGANNDSVYTAIQDSEGNFIVAGTTSSGLSGNKSEAGFGGNDFWLIKLNSSGGIVWQRCFGGNDHDTLEGFQVAADGNLLLIGTSFSNISGNRSQPYLGGSGRITYGDNWLVKVDPNGNKIWDRAYARMFGNLATLTATPDGGAVISSAGSYLRRVDSTGSEIWMKEIAIPAGVPVQLRNTADGGFIVGGIFQTAQGTNFNQGTETYLVKLTSDAEKEWETIFGGARNEFITDLNQTIDGGYIFGGNSVSPSHTASDPSDVWIAKANGSGIVEWSNTLAGDHGDYLSSLQETGDREYAAGAYSASSNSGDKNSPSFGGTDLWLLKLNDGLPETTSNNAEFFWRNPAGVLARWSFEGTNTVPKLINNGKPPTRQWDLVGAGDFNEDGSVDLMWRHNDGSLVEWLLQPDGSVVPVPVASNVKRTRGSSQQWPNVVLGDVSGDGKLDIVWQGKNGRLMYWELNDSTTVQTNFLFNGSLLGKGRQLLAVADFDGDSTAEFLWLNRNSTLTMSWTDGDRISREEPVQVDGKRVIAGKIIGVYDVNADGKTDLVFKSQKNKPTAWIMDGNQRSEVKELEVPLLNPAWKLIATGASFAR